jgi:hypothetical protein
VSIKIICEHPHLETKYQIVEDGVRVTCGQCDGYLYHLLKGKVVYLPIDPTKPAQIADSQGRAY